MCDSGEKKDYQCFSVFLSVRVCIMAITQHHLNTRIGFLSHGPQRKMETTKNVSSRVYQPTTDDTCVFLDKLAGTFNNQPHTFTLNFGSLDGEQQICFAILMKVRLHQDNIFTNWTTCIILCLTNNQQVAKCCG